MQERKKMKTQLMHTFANDAHCTLSRPSTRPTPATAPTMHCVVLTGIPT
jgi:hypothetical protein